MSKKDFTKATNDVAAKFFSAEPKKDDTKIAKDDNDTKHTNVTYNTNVTKHTKHTYVSENKQPHNKSKHYDERGKRSERYGILLDKQLKEDLQLLCSADNNRSLNDFIVTTLLDHVETPENQQKLIAYKKLLNLIGE